MPRHGAQISAWVPTKVMFRLVPVPGRHPRAPSLNRALDTYIYNSLQQSMGLYLGELIIGRMVGFFLFCFFVLFCCCCCWGWGALFVEDFIKLIDVIELACLVHTGKILVEF